MPGKKILIIDDEEDLCLLLKDYFRRKGHDVTISNDLNEGKDLLHKIVPDMVVLDNNLPGGTGWSTASQIAADFPDIYILLISAYNPALPVMPAGAKFNTIEKPISFAELDKHLLKL
ncbi:MAG: response regulator [Flavipsychrobacter sp.]|jgi:DNA-binding response OmpR family regulator|nr:response regulator [Flavipsychrobacter sp.]